MSEKRKTFTINSDLEFEKQLAEIAVHYNMKNKSDVIRRLVAEESNKILNEKGKLSKT